uniref:CASAMP N-terminal domain-containing protein n=1 Tax=Astyanax mexicanus TaxID=7994 RepID=A0A8B9HX95_ASTMX
MVDAAGARRPELEPDVPVPEITPLDRYEPGRARARAGVRWLIGKAYGRAGMKGRKEGGCNSEALHPCDCACVGARVTQ